MTLTQLEYIVAVDTYRNFVLAAEKCFVTQPTLSMQIQKLEEMLKVKIFDRSKQPVVPTELGVQIISQARVVLFESLKIQELVNNQNKEIKGELKVGVIPTVAPYLLPKVIISLLQKYPGLRLLMWEYTTEEIVARLKTGELECGILATPLADSSIEEVALYYENFVAYVGEKSDLYGVKQVESSDFEREHIWVLNEGHCMRNQVLNICRGLKQDDQPLTYHTGSMETLMRMVDINGGATLLPELALTHLPSDQLNKIRRFKSPEPAREISVVTHKNFIKKRMLSALKQEILLFIPKKMQERSAKSVISV